MEASISGMHHSAAHGSPQLQQSPRFVIFCAAHQHTSVSRQWKASLCLVRGSVRRKGGGQHGLSCSRSRRSTAVRAQEAEVISQGEVADVEEIEGIRVSLNEQKRPMVEYLIKWKDGSPHTWEPAENLADNLLRDFETAWWTACREGDVQKIRKLLATSGRVLANTVDENRRSGLHFVAATGNAACARLFCKAGADLNLCDKDGYTPLHMAVGYSHVATVDALLEAGADPEVQDRQSRDVVALVQSIRDQMPVSPQFMGRRMALEQVTALLSENLFEEVEPAAVLDTRSNENGTRDFLIKWPDGAEDSWVSQWNVASDVVEDHDAGLEYGRPQAILKRVQRGDAREYLVQWSDDYPDSWEPEDHLPQHLIAEWEEQQRQRLLASMPAAPAHSGNGKAQRQQQRGGSEERAREDERASSRDRAGAFAV